MFTIRSSLWWQKKVTLVSFICFPMQIWQVTHKYKKEVKKLLKIFHPLIHLQNRERSLYFFPSAKQGFTCIFFFRDQVPKNVLFFLKGQVPKMSFFPLLLIKTHSLSFFSLWDNVSYNFLFCLFLFLCRSSSLLIEQVMASETSEFLAVVWSR